MKINLLAVVVILAVLKYFGVEPIASWGWVWIFSPLWISVILFGLGLLVTFVIAYLMLLFGVKRK